MRPRTISPSFLDFLGEARLERVGAFPYSEVPGAVANSFENQVPEQLKQERFARLMAAQQEISLSINQSKVGREIEVIIDDYGEFPGDLVGRTKADAPGIDGNVFATSDGTVKIGDIVKVKITGATAYDLMGDVVGAVAWRPNVLSMV